MKYTSKRVFDLLLTVPILIVLSPLLLATAVLVRLKLGSPVLFRQMRPGLYGKPLQLYKFRTMTSACDEEGNPLSDADRLTPFGHFLRSTSLDELPELINVLRGEMSLVGPRPLLPEYLAHYGDDVYRRHDVLPGLTGWAQVNGRNAITWEDKFALDLWYVDNWSIRLDLKILAMTLAKIVRREGISQAGHATVERFR